MRSKKCNFVGGFKDNFKMIINKIPPYFKSAGRFWALFWAKHGPKHLKFDKECQLTKLNNYYLLIIAVKLSFHGQNG